MNDNPVFSSMLDTYQSRKAAYKNAKQELKKWLADNGDPKKVKKKVKLKAEKAPKSDKNASKPATTKTKAVSSPKKAGSIPGTTKSKTEVKPVAKTTTTRRRVSPKTEAK